MGDGKRLCNVTADSWEPPNEELWSLSVLLEEPVKHLVRQETTEIYSTFRWVYLSSPL